ncbi:MAG: permease-like cell division protein FtsX [Bacteroidaceae bacterium]|nr:permease-like cell division protein FtsX [Bacteroidaceae bacterium]
MGKRGILRWQFLTSTISTTMVLLLLGALVLFVLTAREIRNYVHQNLTVTIVMADGTTPTAARDIEHQIARKTYIHHVNYISSEQALQEQVKAMGIDPRDLLDKNPFSISMELKLEAPYVCADSLQWIVEDLRQEKAIIDVIYQKELVDSLNRNLNTITIILLAITIVLSVISISLINNTVHMSVYSRRFIINNMKLIGARRSFIRRPFMLRSLGIGLISTIIADGILVGLLHWATQFDQALLQFIPQQNVLIMAASVLGFALIITLVCTYISVTRFIAMGETDLYR